MDQPLAEIRFDEVWELVRRLSPREKVRLIERIAPDIEAALTIGSIRESKSLLGLLADLGPAPTDEEIQSARLEAWSGFPRPIV